MNPALYPVLAGLFGLTQGPHNRGIYEGYPKKNCEYFGLPKFSHIPRVGDERGDRAEIERIFGGTFALAAGQPTIISRELPVGDPWLVLRLNLRGQVNGAAGAAGTVLADAPLGLFSIALSTDVDRDVVEPSVSARALYRHAQILNGIAGELVAPTVVAATVTDFNAVVDIPFIDPRMRIPMDTVLDTRRYNAVTLTINTGLITDIIWTGDLANATLQNTFVDVEIVRVSPRVPMPLQVAKVLPFFKRHAPIVPPGATTIDLDRVPTLAIKRIMTLTTGGAGAAASVAGVPFTGTGSNLAVETKAVISNYRHHFGSPAGGVSRRTLQGGNIADYQINPWPAGWYVADFNIGENSQWNALATGDKSILQAVYTYQAAPPATPQLSLFIAGLQRLRGKEAA